MTENRASGGGERRAERMRPSRQEKEPFITAINNALADGRIDADEHMTRVEKAESATSFDDLDALVTDIPFEWHDEELAKAKRATRRQVMLGSAGFLILGGLSWFGTRTLIDRTTTAEAAPPTPAPTTGTAPGPEDPTETGDLPRSMVQVVNWRTDTMETALDYAESQGIVRVSDISAWDEYFVLEGATKDGKPRRLSFYTDRRPEIENLEDDGAAQTSIAASKLKHIDVKRLLAEAQKAEDLGETTEGINLRIRFWPEMWTIGIGADGHEVYWHIDARRRWDPDTEWPTG